MLLCLLLFLINQCINTINMTQQMMPRCEKKRSGFTVENDSVFITEENEERVVILVNNFTPPRSC